MERLHDLLDGLDGSYILENGEQAPYFELGLLGILSTTDGPKYVELLKGYLRFLRNINLKTPDLLEVKHDQVASFLDLSVEDTAMLGRIVFFLSGRGPLLANSSHANDYAAWQYNIPDRVDEIPEADLDGFLDKAVSEFSDPNAIIWRTKRKAQHSKAIEGMQEPGPLATPQEGDLNDVDSQQPQIPQRLVPEIPQQTLDTYSRLWQLETWLRRMVYVELRALAGDDWASTIRSVGMDADKRLIHMATPISDPLSFAQFSELRRLISANWRLFANYLPPQSIWDAKIEEVSQIRHRVAHFRPGHQDDLQRVTQLIRDIDLGVWRFCTSYNDSRPVLPQSDDPVEMRFLALDSFPWSPVGDGWARIGMADPEARYDMIIEVLCRPWAQWTIPVTGKEGFLYDIRIHARQSRLLDYKQFLTQTSPLHLHFGHICLSDDFRWLRLTLPAILGAKRIIEILDEVDRALLYCLSQSVGGSQQEGAAQRLADSWPDYVLGPGHPLAFLTPDMPCSIFGA